MKDRLPRPRDLAFFLLLAVACTAVVAVTADHDAALALLGASLFFVSALMGFRRSEEKARANHRPSRGH